MKNILLSLLLTSIVSFAQTPCDNGNAGSFPCSGFDLMSHIDLNTLNAGSGNDSWGWTDPVDGKEYALMGLNNGTAFIDVSQLGKEKMPNIKKRQDMGLWLVYLKKIPYAYGIQKCHAIYRIRENSLSRNKKGLISYQWEFYREVEKLSIFQSIYYMLCWMYYGYKKYK
jgi:hypothetical protein